MQGGGGLSVEEGDGEEEEGNEAEREEGDYHWFYKGRNGWWQYDLRTSKEIENHHKVWLSGLYFDWGSIIT